MSNSEQNKLVRVLSGTRLAYTIRFLLKDGREIECQSAVVPKIEWDSDLREKVIKLKAVANSYDSDYTVARFDDVVLTHVEKNPE